MLRVVTEQLRRQSLSEVQPFQLQISCPPGDEDSDDSEGENQELAQIDRERRRDCALTPLATNQLQNQEKPCCRARGRLHASLDCHSSEEELERISREFAAEKRKWCQGSRCCCRDSTGTSSSDDEVQALCAVPTGPGPVRLRASSPKRPQPLARSPPSRALLPQGTPCKRHRCRHRDKGARPSLDLEKMQQKMLLKKKCGAKSRVIKIHSISGGRPPPHFVYDPSSFAFRSLSTLKPLSPLAVVEEPSCAC